MASILRSSKFVRYIAGFARHVVINTPREFDGSFVNTTQCFCSILPRNLATQATYQNEQNLELSIKRLDQDVRRAGRISRRDIEDVLEEIRSSRSATSSQSLMVIRCCGNLVPEEQPEIRTQLVQEIWNTLIKLNVPMDISHYNALLRVYLDNRHPFLPTEFLSELEAKGIEPNRVTYQQLITRYCMLGDIEGATRILEFMKEKQLPVNENVFNSLIMGHCQTGDIESAQGILSVMGQAGLEPSADTCTTLLCGYAKLGDIETMNKLFNEYESKDVYLLDKDYLEIVYALAVNGHEVHVPVVLNKVRKAFGYAQDAINVIFRLINSGKDNTAILVLKTMPRGLLPDGTLQPTGAFLIRHLIKEDRPIDKVLEICEYFENEQMHDRALLLAAETSLQLAKEKLAYPLLAKLQTKGIPIRQHYFWPLIVAKSEDQSGNQMIEVLQQMRNFNITPSSETIRDYVIPNLKGTSSDIIGKLREANLSVGATASNLLHHLLQKKDLEEAAFIVSSVNAYYSPALARRPLVKAFYSKKDIKSYIIIVRHIYENVDRLDAINTLEGDDQTPVDKNEVVGQMICDLAHHHQFPNVVYDLLEGLVEEGLSITTTAATKIQDALGEKLTPEVSNLLARLSSGELSLTPLRRRPVYTPSEQMSIPQLEKYIENLTRQGADVIGLKRQLLTLYCRAKELVKMEELLKTLDDSFIYSAGVYAQLIDVYSYHDDLEQSLKYYKKLKELDNNIGLDDLKVIRVVGLLIKNNRLEEGLQFLNEQSRERKPEDWPYPYTSQCWKILNSLAEEGKDEELNILFNTLLNKDYIQASNVLLGPLIKVHLIKNEVDKALEKFEWCCMHYKATPFKNELACKLIESEDADKLQKLTDLSTSVHGEVNSLYDLVFAFVECGRIRQARKILETPGMQVRTQRLNNACQRFHEEGMVKSLEGLKDATKDLNHIDRSNIYYQLLLSYTNHIDVDKALGLWTQMQEEDMMPTNEFLITLGNFLSERGLKVPFVMPQIKERQIAESAPVSKRSFDRNEWHLFRQAVKIGDLQEARKFRAELKGPLSTIDGSNYIELLIKKSNLHEATMIMLEMVQHASPPITRVFRFILNKLSNIGDIKTLDMLASQLTTELKKSVSFDNRLCHAYLVAGRAEEYIEMLQKEIDNVNIADIHVLAEKFPRGGMVGILENKPELIDKYEKLALAYSEKGVISPINVLWSFYFLNGNEAKANNIWGKYLQNTPRVMFQRILQQARESTNQDIVRKLLEQLKTSLVTEGALGNAHSCLLDIVIAKGEADEVVSVFETVIKDTKLEYINRTALLRVKGVYERLGKPFNYQIPARTHNTFTQAASSDDEVLFNQNPSTS